MRVALHASGGPRLPSGRPILLRLELLAASPPDFVDPTGRTEADAEEDVLGTGPRGRSSQHLEAIQREWHLIMLTAIATPPPQLLAVFFAGVRPRRSQQNRPAAAPTLLAQGHTAAHVDRTGTCLVADV